MEVRDYDPAQGQAFQGDVAIVPIPDDIAIATHDEIASVRGRLILQAGELSGHHHAIYLLDSVARFRDDGLARALLDEHDPAMTEFAPAAEAGTAQLYRDPTVATRMVSRGLLTRSDLAIGCLVVEGGTVVVNHEEHDGLRIPPGNYLVGRQVERAGAAQRVVRD